MEDRNIIEYYLARDERAVEETQKAYGRMCYSVAMNILARHEDAEECVNDAYLRVWESIPPEHPQNLGAYLCRITRNLSINRWHAARSEKRNGGQTAAAIDELSEIISAEDEGTVLLDSIALRDAMQRYLRGQRSTVRNVFIQRYWYTRPIADIAEQFGMSENRIKVMLHRTRAGMRDALRKEGFEL